MYPAPAIEQNILLLPLSPVSRRRSGGTLLAQHSVVEVSVREVEHGQCIPSGVAGGGADVCGWSTKLPRRVVLHAVYQRVACVACVYLVGWGGGVGRCAPCYLAPTMSLGVPNPAPNSPPPQHTLLCRQVVLVGLLWSPTAYDCAPWGRGSACPCRSRPFPCPFTCPTATMRPGTRTVCG